MEDITGFRFEKSILGRKKNQERSLEEYMEAEDNVFPHDPCQCFARFGMTGWHSRHPTSSNVMRASSPKHVFG
jgi:hypothetical protein